MENICYCYSDNKNLLNLLTENGHNIINYLLPNSKKRKLDLYDEKLENSDMDIDNIIIQSNSKINRKYPTSKPYVNDLFKRYYHQIKNSDSIFIVNLDITMDKNTNNCFLGEGIDVKAFYKNFMKGTYAWPLQLYVDKCDNLGQEINCYIYMGGWYKLYIKNNKYQLTNISYISDRNIKLEGKYSIFMKKTCGIEVFENMIN